jgi:Domain of unknown function (DUF4365)
MPIPANAVKDLLSRGFLRLVASHAGFVPSGTDELDFGVDIQLKHIECVHHNGRPRYCASGFAVDVQLKATCETEIRRVAGSLHYDLDAKNYNDLVRRARKPHTIPLILALFVLPDDVQQWLSLADSELTLRRCGYVWRPSPSDTETDNASTRTIAIPQSSRIDHVTFEKLFEEYAA